LTLGSFGAIPGQIMRRVIALTFGSTLIGLGILP
jgi:hypothetical protein